MNAPWSTAPSYHQQGVAMPEDAFWMATWREPTRAVSIQWSRAYGVTATKWDPTKKEGSFIEEAPIATEEERAQLWNWLHHG